MALQELPLPVVHLAQAGRRKGALDLLLVFTTSLVSGQCVLPACEGACRLPSKPPLPVLGQSAGCLAP